MPTETTPYIIDLIQRASASRALRQEKYAYLRLWYSRGTDTMGWPARYNKLESHNETVTSYLYSPDSTRFYLHLPPEEKEQWQFALPVAADAFTDRWRAIGADVLFNSMVEWANVYGSVVAKVLPSHDNQAQVTYIYPGDVGVLREDLPQIDRQDVIVHWFSMSLGELDRLTKYEPTHTEIMKWAQEHAQQAGQTREMFPSMVQQVIVSNVTGSFPAQQTQGFANIMALQADQPDVQERLVECVEVWERVDMVNKKRKDRYADYLVHTVIGDRIIKTRLNPVLPYSMTGPGLDLPSESPFVMVTPHPYLDYFWGRSEIAGLVQLQKWREDRMVQTDDIVVKKLDPAKFFSGVSIPDEKLRALRHPGAFVSTPNPNAKMEAVKTDVNLQEILVFIHEIDAMFADKGGIPPVMQGVNPEGARAGEQVGALAAIASGRTRSKAMTVEDSLEALSTKIFHLMQRHDPTTYRDTQGKPFLLSQLPGSSVVKVSAHSASPIYAEATSRTADELLLAGAIDLEDYVELKNPPMKDYLKAKARLLQAGKAKMAQEVLRVKEIAALRRGRP